MYRNWVNCCDFAKQYTCRSSCDIVDGFGGGGEDDVIQELAAMEIVHEIVEV